MATLATLILLSYTKLLQTIITSFSYANLKYPNGTTITKWLPDASVEYGERKHIALICVAILILILGLLYTVLILSWQWLLQCSRLKLFKWTRNQKLHSFIVTYHTPHSPKHRYWTGLLLLVRGVVYLIAAFSISVDPRITLLSTVAIICCLLVYKTMFIVRVYKNWLLNAMESFMHLNIAIFAVFTLYTFDESGNRNREILQTVAAYISVGTMFILFLVVITFHIYRYGNAKLYSFMQSTKVGKLLKGRTSHDLSQDHCTQSESKLFDVIDSRREGSGYAPPGLQPHQGPTKTVISLTNCEKQTNLKYPFDQLVVQQDSQENDERDKKKSRQAKTQIPKIRMTEFEVGRKTDPILFKETLDESIRKPLLEEDKP